jgi:histidinol-phosphate aminotransferase
MSDITDLVRKNIAALKPYSSARSEFKGHATVYLDANENSFGSPVQGAYNRYPDPLQGQLKAAISGIKGLPLQNIFLGNGSDEAIDLLIRIFCEPGTDNIVICPPTYGMYEVSAAINDVPVKRVDLLPGFALNVPGILQAADVHSKLLFICSPNNPTGNSFSSTDIEQLLAGFKGVVVVDEAYINYSSRASCIQLLTRFPNLVVLQTFSKAWGLAALRLGMAFASETIIMLMNKVKPPYNISGPAQQLALNALAGINWVNEHIKQTVAEREKLHNRLTGLGTVEHVYPSDANFLLVKIKQPVAAYRFLVQQGIIVRDRSTVALCEGCLRITIGTPAENDLLINALQQYTP